MSRAPFEPTEKDRHLVGVLCGMGLKHEQIAACLLNPYSKKSIDLKTLRKHFKEELKTGADRTKGAICGSLYNKCMAGDTNAIKWWQMNRMGWTDRGTHEHSGPGGAAIPITTVTARGTPDYEAMSDEELSQVYRDGLEKEA